MGYSTPHSAREYLLAACLRINHEFILHSQNRSGVARKAILLETREIDLCAMMGGFFGRAGHLAAQGVGNDSAADLDVAGPTIRCEVKYFRPSARAWGQLSRDWTWILGGTNTGREFSKRGWVVFWPSTSLFKFTNCLSVSRSQGASYSKNDLAPFLPYAEAEMPKKGVNQRLRFRKKPERVSILQVPGGKRVRCDLVGATNHPLWAAVYTRITPGEAAAMPEIEPIVVNGDVLPSRG